MAISATQRTLAALREQGRRVEVAERWMIIPKHPAGGVRKDLFGFIDLVALDEEQNCIVAIQSFTTAFAAHLRIILEDVRENAIAWLRCGGRIELWGWRKVKVKRGGKAMRWEPRIQVITMEDFA